MTDSLYLLGAPGVGKSTALAGVLDRLGLVTTPEPSRLHGTLRGHALIEHASGAVVGAYLGVMRPQFPGTDALSMAVSPHAREWVASLGEHGESHAPRRIVGEGARLGTVGFLGDLGAATTLTLIHLRADDNRLEARRDGRGSTQSPAWMRGAATRARNAYLGAIAADAPARFADIDTSDLEPDEVVARIVALAH
ncbi:hypothetical protein SEA_KOZIE_4 [Microbacterium phage Kozie]|uniref:Uncharacterized protein n=1 Tax=Microbacterium phage Kozie TaxID=2885981 RepID=A0AAE8Y7N6_9CAUD|nr:hypothetical protein QC998_gp04 [Microbacterium phage Kozie]UDL16200.1 hypothetical protein SEA_KOZIE_4 [Microbacterium phage Kozie]